MINPPTEVIVTKISDELRIAEVVVSIVTIPNVVTEVTVSKV